MVAPWAGFT